jgi:hypothetical protein
MSYLYGQAKPVAIMPQEHRKCTATHEAEWRLLHLGVNTYAHPDAHGKAWWTNALAHLLLSFLAPLG